MSAQTVYFTNPSVISGIQTSQTSMSGSITALNSTTSVLQSHQYDIGNQCWGKFLHGVMSGDPSSSSCVICTNVTVNVPSARDALYLYFVVGTGTIGSFDDPTSDVDFNTKAVWGRIRVVDTLDYTAKLKVTGLLADTTYYYKFYSMVEGSYSQQNQTYWTNPSNRGPTSTSEYTIANAYDRSQLGKFKTLPAGSISNIKFAAFGCQAMSKSYFNHLFQIAQLNKAGKVDYVLNAGDFIYTDDGTQKLNPYSKPAVSANGSRIFNETFEDYCLIYKSYKQDPDWQECFRRTSLITVWNDHEFTNGIMFNPTDQDKFISTDFYYNYLSDGTLNQLYNGIWTATGAQAQLPAGTTGPVDNTKSIMRYAVKAWCCHLPMNGGFAGQLPTVYAGVGLQLDNAWYTSPQGGQNSAHFTAIGSSGSIGATATESFLQWTSTGGFSTLDRSYKFGDLVSVHILDDCTRNYVRAEDLNPYYNNLLPVNGGYPYTGFYTIANPSGPFTSYSVKPVGWTGSFTAINWPSLSSFATGGGYNTGAFVEACKPILLWRDYMQYCRKGLDDSQLTNLNTRMTTNNTKWNIILQGRSVPHLPMSTLSDGWTPSNFTGTTYTNSIALTPYGGTYGPSADSKTVWPLIAQAQRELFAAGLVNYPITASRAGSSCLTDSYRNSIELINVIQNFKNTIVLGSDYHASAIGHMHTMTGMNNLVTAGRTGTSGLWANYAGATGVVDTTAYPIVGTFVMLMTNAGNVATCNWTSQSASDKDVNNGYAELLKIQDPRLVDYAFGPNLLTGRGFTLFDISSTGCDIKNLFVGGYNVANTTTNVRNFLNPSNQDWSMFPTNGLYRDNTLSICSEYLIPFNSSSTIGNQPTQIIKPNVKWTGYDLLPTGYPYKIPANCTGAANFVSYNTPITPSQL